MKTMVDKNLILLSYYRNGESQRSISARLKISRKTVRRYIAEHENMRSSENAKELLEKGISSKPSYDISGRERLKLNTEIENLIGECLLANRQKAASGLGKQRMKKIDIYEFLKSKDHVIGYTTVCNYIREAEVKESFIKQIYHPGHTCEFDWGEVKLYFMGKLQVLNLAVFTSGYSNYRWSKLFYRQDTLAFSQSHIDFFEHIGGVFKEMVYDNMRVAVRKFVGHHQKEATTALLELSNYYKFGFRFCNARRGNEKGHVERSVEYIRRKAFSRTTSFEDITQANAHLCAAIEILNAQEQKLAENMTANELIIKEKVYLFQAPDPYISFEMMHSKADKYATVIVYGNRYSVPDFLATHPRSYGAHTWNVDINHYLPTLMRKPGALKGSLAFDQSGDKIKDIFVEYFSDDARGFIELLQNFKDKNWGIETLEKAITRLKQISPLDISKDKIMIMIDKQMAGEKKENTQGEIHKCSKELLKELAELYN
jgi:transposase